MSQQTLKIDLIRETDFCIETSESTVYIIGTTFTLPAFNQNIFAGKNLVVQAYDLTIPASLNLPSKNVSITTRTLRIPARVKISVGGVNGAVARPAKANNGRSPGDHGKSGKVGNNGATAGAIELTYQAYEGEMLTLESIGGDGGIAQVGGDGQNGKPGANARERRPNDRGPGHVGGRGFAGGNAGNGGIGGTGGNGGRININTTDADVDSNIRTSVNGGSGGSGAGAGSPGNGGPGGRGSKGVDCEFFDRPGPDHF